VGVRTEWNGQWRWKEGDFHFEEDVDKLKAKLLREFKLRFKVELGGNCVDLSSGSIIVQVRSCWKLFDAVREECGGSDTIVFLAGKRALVNPQILQVYLKCNGDDATIAKVQSFILFGRISGSIVNSLDAMPPRKKRRKTPLPEVDKRDRKRAMIALEDGELLKEMEQKQAAADEERRKEEEEQEAATLAFLKGESESAEDISAAQLRAERDAENQAATEKLLKEIQAPIAVLIEGDMLPKRLQAKVNVGSLEEFKAAVANAAKISIDEFDLEVSGLQVQS
jgi:hypothetical protein